MKKRLKSILILKTTMSNARNLLNPLEQKWVVDRIRKAESETTGELKVHLEDYAEDDQFNRAAELFAALGMHKTKYRNGVLIYIAAKDHEFVVMGDMAINQVVPEGFWEEMANILHNDFHMNDYFEGIAKVIRRVGVVLKTHFPKKDTDTNEITDEISFG